jgi:tetratricopeptide (TPR) repeat protein
VDEPRVSGESLQSSADDEPRIALMLGKAEEAFRSGLFPEAIAECESALALNPSHLAALRQLNDIYEAQEERDVAALLEEARAKISTGSLTEAGVLVERASLLRPDSEQVRALGETLSTLRPDEKVDEPEPASDPATEDTQKLPRTSIPTHPRSPNPPRKSAPSTSTVAAAAVIVVGLLGVGGWLWTRDASPEPPSGARAEARPDDALERAGALRAGGRIAEAIAIAISARSQPALTVAADTLLTELVQEAASAATQAKDVAVAAGATQSQRFKDADQREQEASTQDVVANAAQLFELHSQAAADYRAAASEVVTDPNQLVAQAERAYGDRHPDDAVSYALSALRFESGHPGALKFLNRIRDDAKNPLAAQRSAAAAAGAQGPALQDADGRVQRADRMAFPDNVRSQIQEYARAGQLYREALRVAQETRSSGDPGKSLEGDGEKKAPPRSNVDDESRMLNKYVADLLQQPPAVRVEKLETALVDRPGNAILTTALAAAREAAARRSTEIADIHAALERYKKAYESRKIENVTGIVRLDAAEERAVRALFKDSRSIQIKLDPGTIYFSSDGLNATVDCQISTTTRFASGKTSPAPAETWRFEFEQQGGWHMVARVLLSR